MKRDNRRSKSPASLGQDWQPTDRGRGIRIRDHKGGFALNADGGETDGGASRLNLTMEKARRGEYVPRPSSQPFELQPTPNDQRGVRQDTGKGGGRFPATRKPNP